MSPAQKITKYLFLISISIATQKLRTNSSSELSRAMHTFKIVHLVLSFGM